MCPGLNVSLVSTGPALVLVGVGLNVACLGLCFGVVVIECLSFQFTSRKCLKCYKTENKYPQINEAKSDAGIITLIHLLLFSLHCDYIQGCTRSRSRDHELSREFTE